MFLRYKVLFNDAVAFQNYINSMIDAYLWSIGGLILKADKIYNQEQNVGS